MPRRDDFFEEELAPLDEFEDDLREPRDRRFPLMVPLIITMVVMTGAATIAWYSYTAGVREGSERAAPLLAPAGPVKVAPATPGGIEIPHREKTVYHALEGTQTDTKVERLLPLPESPMTPPMTPPAGPVPEATDLSRTRAADSVGSGRTEEAVPSQPLQLAPTEEAPAKPPEAPRTAQAPAAKPAPQQESRNAAASAPPKPAASTEIAALPSGSYRIQIGSVSSSEQARRFWEIEEAKNEALLGRLTMTVQKATIQGKDYFRVQGGPLKDRAEAESLCAKLKQRGVGCLVVAPSR